MAEAGRLDPVVGPPARDRSRHPDPLAPHQEQPGADRRAGRRQDGDRRGAGPADRRRRRARQHQGQAGRDAGHGRAGGRHQVSRPVRGAPQARGRRDQGDPLHPVHRRVPHDHRRRRGRGHAGRGEYPQAGALARRAANDRRDHARRVPQVHRARRGAGAALPAGDGRPADRRGDDRDLARHQEPLRGFPSAPDLRRCDQGRRASLGALCARPLPAG